MTTFKITSLVGYLRFISKEFFFLISSNIKCLPWGLTFIKAMLSLCELVVNQGEKTTYVICWGIILVV